MKLKFTKRLFIFLSVLGPSVITTMAGNDGGGVITYSIAGASLGYVALFTLPFLTIFYAITQEMGSRVAIVTQKGMGDLIRENFGIRTSLIIFILLLIANFGSVLTNVAAIKASSSMLGITPNIFIATTILMAFMLVTLTRYEKSQKIFLTGIIFYLAYVFSAIKGQPEWGRSISNMVIPERNIFTKEFIIVSTAVLGTTVTPWGQFFVQSYMKDKKVAVKRLPYARLEAYTGAVISNLVTFFIIIATASTLYINHIVLNSGEQAAKAIRPFAGELSGVLFAVGLVNAGIIGMIIISLASAYAFSEFFGFTGSLDQPYSKGKSFYIIFLINLILPALIVMTPWISVFGIALFTQSLNAILLPVFLYFLHKIINNPALMGQFINGKIYNTFSVISYALIAITGSLSIILPLILK